MTIQKITLQPGGFKPFACLVGLAPGLFPCPVRSQSDEIPAHALGEKDALVFSDDSSTNRFGGAWTERVQSAGVEVGVLFGRQTTTVHGSVAIVKLDLPDGNLICECRVQFEHSVSGKQALFDDLRIWSVKR